MEFLKNNNSNRKKTLPIRGKEIKLPIYFPSISSVKTGKTSPANYFKILQALSPHFLVSAYDIYKSKKREEFIKELKLHIEKDDGAIIILDSGNYEKFWLKDKNWKVEMFNSILKENICDLAFCYDNLNPKSFKSNVSFIKESINLSQNCTKKSTIIPIVHSNKQSLSKTILNLRNQINFSMVAIPERELGDGIIERVKTITKIRKELNDLDTYIYLHILGTGNPLSLILFSFAGADTFDGLEWCQTVVDSKTALLYHFQQRDLIIDDCEFCNEPTFNYTIKTFAHNLKFYNAWMSKIQKAIDTNTEIELLNEYFNPSIVSQLKNIWK